MSNYKSVRFQKTRLSVLAVSTALFPVSFYYLSPVVSLHGSFIGIVTGSLIVFLFLFVLSMALGRSFCSWLCPAGGLQDQVAKARTARLPVARIGWLKYVVWGFWLAGILFFFREAGGVKGVQFAFDTVGGLPTSSVPALIAYTVVVLVFLSLSLVFGRRAGCHSLCWIAPFVVIGRIIGLRAGLPSLHLRAKPGSCTHCSRCTNACPMSLDVESLVLSGRIVDNDCILCGSCVDTCAKGTIGWAWRRERGKAS